MSGVRLSLIEVWGSVAARCSVRGKGVASGGSCVRRVSRRQTILWRIVSMHCSIRASNFVVMSLIRALNLLSMRLSSSWSFMSNWSDRFFSFALISIDPEVGVGGSVRCFLEGGGWGGMLACV